MDLKVAFVIVCLCALAITSTEGKDPSIVTNTHVKAKKTLVFNQFLSEDELWTYIIHTYIIFSVWCKHEEHVGKAEGVNNFAVVTAVY